jgi:hypothetical protein
MSVLPVMSQKDCTVPEGAVLNKVSVNPATGNTELSWSLSPSSDIAAYIVYNHNTGYWIAKDTIWNPSATSYSLNSPGTKYFSEMYVVAAFRKPICISPLSNSISTIFCTSQIDTCHKKIILNWNKYKAYPYKVLNYRILVSKDGSAMAEAYTADSSSVTFAVSDFETGSQYCFVVKATLEGGNESFSNEVCTSTKMQRPPDWVNADYATVNDQGKIDLAFTFDPLSEITRFILERKEGSSGSFLSVTELNSTNGVLNYTDSQVNILKINYYRISAINNCQLPVTVSNLASNIVLALTKENEVITLKWNKYRKWNGSTGSERVLVNPGDGWAEKYLLPGDDSVYSIRYSDLMYEVEGKEVCFSIEAVETGNPYGSAGRSRSIVACTPSLERITVPNSFTPDNNLVNDKFKPFLSFTPISFRLVITDMKRHVVFTTNDFTSEWDGTDNGKVLPEGPYLCFLKVTSPSDATYARSGTVTIIFNH